MPVPSRSISPSAIPFPPISSRFASVKPTQPTCLLCNCQRQHRGICKKWCVRMVFSCEKTIRTHHFLQIPLEPPGRGEYIYRDKIWLLCFNHHLLIDLLI